MSGDPWVARVQFTPEAFSSVGAGEAWSMGGDPWVARVQFTPEAFPPLPVGSNLPVKDRVGFGTSAL